jgi:hypothetical protein
MVAPKKKNLTPAKRVRGLIEAGTPLLLNINAGRHAATHDSVYNAFEPVRRRMELMMEEGINDKPMFELFQSWQRRYMLCSDLIATLKEDIRRLVESGASDVINLEDDDTRLAIVKAKYYMWQYALIVETVQGIWEVDESTNLPLRRITQVSNDLHRLLTDLHSKG